MRKHTASNPPTVVMTIGHSTRSLEEFIEILQAHGAKLLVDVRTIPRSRHNPQFNKETLPKSLAAVGTGYEHHAGLGGLRQACRNSPNTGLRSAGFRGYADYMQTPEFESNVRDLIEKARKKRFAVMCAEAVPWRCHRSLLADALLVRGINVAHIMSGTTAKEHTLMPSARTSGTCITYPPETLTMDFDSGKEPPL